MSHLLEVENLGKTYRRRSLISSRRSETVAVDDISFTLEQGRTLALVGESGAGKSTAGRLVLRLIEPDTGSVRFDGVELSALSTRELRRMRSRMQMIFQDPYSSLDPRIQIGVSIGEPMKIHLGTNRADREKRAAQLLDRVGLDPHYASRYPYELSGGQLQRVAIARSLTVDPALIVCDEPVAALDVSVRAQVLNLMIDLQDELDIAYLFISHDLSIVECLAHDVAVMRFGRIVEAGSREQIYDAPADEYTRALLDAIPVPDPTKRRFGRDLVAWQAAPQEREPGTELRAVGNQSSKASQGA